MCIFRVSKNRKYFCGKRYPLHCAPQVCPFGEILWQGLVNRDFKVESFWLMPGMRLVSAEEAWEALRSNEAEYVVKRFSFRVGVEGGRKLRGSPQHS